MKKHTHRKYRSKNDFNNNLILCSKRESKKKKKVYFLFSSNAFFSMIYTLKCKIIDFKSNVGSIVRLRNLVGGVSPIFGTLAGV